MGCLLAMHHALHRMYLSLCGTSSVMVLDLLLCIETDIQGIHLLPENIHHMVRALAFVNVIEEGSWQRLVL